MGKRILNVRCNDIEVGVLDHLWVKLDSDRIIDGRDAKVKDFRSINGRQRHFLDCGLKFSERMVDLNYSDLITCVRGLNYIVQLAVGCILSMFPINFKSGIVGKERGSGVRGFVFRDPLRDFVGQPGKLGTWLAVIGAESILVDCVNAVNFRVLVSFNVFSWWLLRRERGRFGESCVRTQ
ncbi:hypothetical protein ABYF34_02735 [Buchananella felis]|uniref:hypothetical protein n=1 Tax=Buchananella felis TaxID=3231492 RepID=UPI003527573E